MSNPAEAIAHALSRVCPLDAGAPEIMGKHWEAANQHAAAEVVKMLPDYKSVNTGAGRRNELASRMMKDARRIRNEYLKAVAGG